MEAYTKSVIVTVREELRAGNSGLEDLMSLLEFFKQDAGEFAGKFDEVSAILLCDFLGFRENEVLGSAEQLAHFYFELPDDAKEAFWESVDVAYPASGTWDRLSSFIRAIAPREPQRVASWVVDWIAKRREPQVIIKMVLECGNEETLYRVISLVPSEFMTPVVRNLMSFDAGKSLVLYATDSGRVSILREWTSYLSLEETAQIVIDLGDLAAIQRVIDMFDENGLGNQAEAIRFLRDHPPADFSQVD